MKSILAAAVLLSVAASVAEAATIHIVAFGDSATAGYLVPQKDAYPAQLQRALRQKGYDVEVSDAGINGDTTAGALRRFDSAIAPGTDVAIVEFGTNDLRMRVPIKTVEARLSEIVRTLHARRVQVLLAGLGRLDLSAVGQANNVPYAQWTLPPGKYRARDGAHFNAEGYAILVRQMLPAIEALIKQTNVRR
jgi:acyl-CoA thioesterase-1